MLNDQMLDVLHGASVMFLGTRSAALMPWGTRAYGAKASPDRKSITFFLPQVSATRPLADLRENRKVALTVGEPATHKTYQFKGSFEEAKAMAGADRAVQDIYLSKLGAVLQALGFPEGFLATYVFQPGWAVRFKVEEVFDQTPGPGAGKRVAP